MTNEYAGMYSLRTSSRNTKTNFPDERENLAHKVGHILMRVAAWHQLEDQVEQSKDKRWKSIFTYA